MYLIDANVLINAARNYYEFGRVNEYWSWILFQCQTGNVKVPLPVFDEILFGVDRLVEWSKKNKKIILLNEELDLDLYRKVVKQGYSLSLNSKMIEKIGVDSRLIDFALVDKSNRTVVTAERKSNSILHNRRIPSVCEDLGVKYCDPFEFGRQLNFSTKWEKSL